MFFSFSTFFCLSGGTTTNSVPEKFPQILYELPENPFFLQVLSYVLIGVFGLVDLFCLFYFYKYIFSQKQPISSDFFFAVFIFFLLFISIAIILVLILWPSFFTVYSVLCFIAFLTACSFLFAVPAIDRNLFFYKTVKIIFLCLISLEFLVILLRFLQSRTVNRIIINIPADPTTQIFNALDANLATLLQTSQTTLQGVIDDANTKVGQSGDTSGTGYASYKFINDIADQLALQAKNIWDTNNPGGGYANQMYGINVQLSSIIPIFQASSFSPVDQALFSLAQIPLLNDNTIDTTNLGLFSTYIQTNYVSTTDTVKLFGWFSKSFAQSLSLLQLLYSLKTTKDVLEDLLVHDVEKNITLNPGQSLLQNFTNIFDSNNQLIQFIKYPLPKSTSIDVLFLDPNIVFSLTPTAERQSSWSINVFKDMSVSDLQSQCTEANSTFFSQGNSSLVIATLSLNNAYYFFCFESNRLMFFGDFSKKSLYLTNLQSQDFPLITGATVVLTVINLQSLQISIFGKNNAFIKDIFSDNLRLALSYDSPKQDNLTLLKQFSVSQDVDSNGLPNLALNFLLNDVLGYNIAIVRMNIPGLMVLYNRTFDLPAQVLVSISYSQQDMETNIAIQTNSLSQFFGNIYVDNNPPISPPV